MKAKLLFTALMLFCGITAQAQSDVLTATLTHNGVHTTYTGRNCLTDALAASADGDVVALSAGNFSHNSYTITKPITLRGAGCEAGSIHTPTELKFLAITIPATNDGLMVVEGIRFKINGDNTWDAPNLRIQNCDLRSCYLYLFAKQAHLYNSQFYSTHFYSKSSHADFQVQQCYGGSFYLEKGNNNDLYTINFANCRGSIYQYTSNVTAIFNHCAFSIDGITENPFSGCSFINSALYYNSMSQSVSDFRLRNTFTCCLVYEDVSSGSSDYVRFYKDNSIITTLSSSMSSTTNFWSDYRPASSFRDKCTTTDGTEIGYMGGAYNAVTGLSYPHFGTCTVPAVTDEDGHLNVKITVSGVE